MMLCCCRVCVVVCFLLFLRVLFALVVLCCVYSVFIFVWYDVVCMSLSDVGPMLRLVVLILLVVLFRCCY